MLELRRCGHAHGIHVVLLAAVLNLAACGQREPIAATPAKAAACGACHPRDGQRMAPMFPLLAGQNPDYLAAQLHAFRDGSRRNPIMNAMARDLDDEQIDALARYYGALGASAAVSRGMP